MFAVLNIYNNSNAGSRLAFTVQAFFMPGHIVYHIWYPCTPVWNCNGTTAFELNVLSSGKGTDTFILKTICLCLTNQLNSTAVMLTTATERPPTKRVPLLSPLPAILTSISPLTVSTFMDAPSATCAVPINPATPLPDASTSPGVKRLRELPATKPLSSFWWRRIVNIVAMWQSVISASVSAIMLHGCLAIRNSRSTIVTSPLYNHSFHNTPIPAARPAGIFVSNFPICGHFQFILNLSIMIYHFNPPHPLNKKRGNIEARVLKRKLFIKYVQLSNSPTRKNILKSKSL